MKPVFLVPPFLLFATACNGGGDPFEGEPELPPALPVTMTADELDEIDAPGELDEEGFEVVDLLPAHLDGDFGLLELDEIEPATVARLRFSQARTGLYFDRTADDGGWSMIQMFHPSPPSQLLPTAEEPVVELSAPDADGVTTVLICSRSGSNFSDRRAETVTITWLGEADSFLHYELAAEGPGVSVRARFRL